MADIIETAKANIESVKEEAKQKIAQGADKVQETRNYWEELKHKIDVGIHIKKELEDLHENFSQMEFTEVIQKFKGIFVIGILGMLMDKEEFDQWKQERRESGVRTRTNEKRLEEGYEVDEIISKKQTKVNTHAIVYYDKNGEKLPEEKMNRSAKEMERQNIIPPTSIINGPDELLNGNLGDYNSFKERVMDYLVHPSVKNQAERERQAAVILSRCAVGRFQIIPSAHFNKLGWSVDGNEGLLNMYKFIKSSDRQYHLFRAIIDKSWEKHHDVGLVALEYYKGPGKAKAYKANPNAPEFTKRQGPMGKDGKKKYPSIRDYVQNAEKDFEETKKRHPHLSEVECLAIVIEKKETRGNYARERILGGSRASKLNQKESSELVTEHEKRVLTYPIQKERMHFLKDYDIHEERVEPTLSKREEIRIKESLKKALDEANKLAAKDGYQIIVISGYRSPGAQRGLYEKAKKKHGKAARSWVGIPGHSWHQSGGAVDVGLYKIGDDKKRLTAFGSRQMKDPNFRPYNRQLEKYMNTVGFVRLENEAWHFEIGTEGWVKIMQQQGVLAEGDSRGMRYTREGNENDKTYHQKIDSWGGQKIERPSLQNEVDPSLKEIIEDKGDGMKTFAKIEKLNEGGGQAQVEKLAGNGGREVLTYIPPGVDLHAKDLKIIYHFHGTNSHNLTYVPPEKRIGTGDDKNKKQWVGWNRMKQTTDAINELAAQGENVILVYPKSIGPRREPNTEKKDYDRLWMSRGRTDTNGKKSDESFDEMHAQVLQNLGLKPSQVARVEAQGHSAGGVPLRNIAQSGTNLIDEYRFLDASYGDWAEDCYNASRNHGNPKVTLIVSKYTAEKYDAPKKQVRSKYANKMGENWEAANSSVYRRREVKPNMEVIISTVTHGNMPRKFTGGLEAKKQRVA